VFEKNEAFLTKNRRKRDQINKALMCGQKAHSPYLISYSVKLLIIPISICIQKMLSLSMKSHVSAVKCDTCNELEKCTKKVAINRETQISEFQCSFLQNFRTTISETVKLLYSTY